MGESLRINAEVRRLENHGGIWSFQLTVNDLIVCSFLHSDPATMSEVARLAVGPALWPHVEPMIRRNVP